MNVYINEAICYGEVCNEYIKIMANVKDDYDMKYSICVDIEPNEEIVMNVSIDFEDEDYSISMFEYYESLLPGTLVKVHKYFRDKMELLRIFRESILYSCDIDFEPTVENEHFEYYLDVIGNLFLIESERSIVLDYDEDEFQLDEHIN